MTDQDRDRSTPPTATVTVDLRRRHAALARQRRLLGGLATVPGFRIGVRWQGADGISGDFYDTWAMPDGRIHVALGDVSGHGVSAALVMASLLKAMRLRRETAVSPGRLLAALNRDLAGDTAPGDFATLWLAEIAPGGTALAASAGHHAAFLVRPDGVYRVEVAGPALGLVPDRAYAPLAFRIGPEEWLVQCSDGLLESAGPDGTAFGDERVAEALARLHGEGCTVEALPDALAGVLAAWSGRPPDDDLTIVALALDGSRHDDDHDEESSAARRAIDAWPLPLRRIAADGEDGDYSLGPAIGSGGAGVVHEGLQHALGRAVAIKRAARSEREPALLREGLIAAALEHPHVLPVHEAGRDPERGPFLAMRRPAGSPWRQRMAEFDLDRNLEILIAVAEAAAGAHRRGIIHRDIKPDNVLLGEDGAVYLFDWGVAAATRGIDPRLAQVVMPPRQDQAAGSPAYMAPEQARGEADRIGPATDVWLLGAVLGEILTGRPPHPGAGVDEALAAAAAAETGPAIDPGEPLGRVVAAACDPDPARRPRDAAAFRDLLARCRRDRQALLMVREALRRSREAGESMTSHLRALAIAEEALRLRPDESEIRDAVAAVRAAYALVAIAQGDLALAMSLVDPALPGHAEIAGTLARALEARRRADERQVRLEDLDRRSAGSWITVADGVAGDWRACGSIGTWSHGTLVSMNYTQVAAVAPSRLSGDVHVQAHLQSGPHPLARVGIFLASRESQAGGRVPEDAYIAWVASDGCGLSRAGTEVAGAKLRMIPGRPVQVDLMRKGPQLVLSVDGVRALDWTDPAPLGDPDRDRIGIVAWEGSATLLAWRVRRFGIPEVEDALDMAERQLLRGNHATAADLVADVLPTAVGARLERARRLEEQIRADAAVADRHRRTADLIREAVPGARTSIRQGGLHATLPRTLATLDPVAGLPLSGIECEATGAIRDLAPLRGMPLRKLALPDHQVEDLTPLAGMPLTDVMLSGNPVAGLTALAGMRLNSLALPRCRRIADVAGLAECEMRLLDLGQTAVTDLGPLAGKALMELWLIGCVLHDLGPLAGAPLQRLGLAGTPVTDLGPLAGAPLRVLHLEHSRVADLRPLAGAPLRYLNLAHTPVTALGPLAGSPLQEVVLTGCAIADVSPLAACPMRRLIYGPRIPDGLDRLPGDCVLTYRSLEQQRGA